MLLSKIATSSSRQRIISSSQVALLRSLSTQTNHAVQKANKCGKNSNNSKYNHRLFGMTAGLSALLGTTTTLTLLEEKEESKYRTLPKQKYPSPPKAPVHGAESHHADLNNPPPRPDLPTIPMSEVEEHNTEDSLWFTFRGAVYDMTFFTLGHPGGTPRLLMAAGQDLEPYWEVYRQHLRGHIITWMERYRIGNLSEEDAKAVRENAVKFGDMYETDPIRDPNNLSCTYKPFCGEPRIELLTEDYYTPNELFYVRNHLAVPDIDPDEYVLIVKGKGLKKHKFTLNDLKTMFPKHEVVSTLQCAGNRREDLHGDRKIYISPHWVVGKCTHVYWPIMILSLYHHHRLAIFHPLRPQNRCDLQCQMGRSQIARRSTSLRHGCRCNCPWSIGKPKMATCSV